VAVKVLADNWASNDDVRNRFLAEARIMRRIHDRRLVQVYDIGTLDDARPYFVMDYIDGGSLNDLRTQAIDPVRAMRLCAEACRALDVLHAHGIIHRDVTPGNLLLSKTANDETQVLIADLGVAKSMLDAVGATMTAGTPSYMAPEQAVGLTPLDSRVDIYSLTAVTYAMLTGHPPFLVRSIADIAARDPMQTPEPIAGRLGAPSTLDGVMLSGLAADRNRRPSTALLLAQRLEAVASDMQAATAQDPSIFPPPSARMPEFEPAGPYPAPVGPPAFQPSSQPVAGNYLGSGDPYAPSPLTTPPPAALAPSRPISYYILLGLSGLAVFAISMLLTILVLR
jgi:serine/threonine protein kinase